MKIRKTLALSLSLILAMSVLASCGKTPEKSDDKKIAKLTVGFVPSRDPGEIVTVTEPLREMLKEELKKSGYSVEKVDITVGSSYEAVGEGLSAGTIDIGFLPGGTYVLYDDSAKVILTATRNALSIDSDDPKVWNEKKPTQMSTDQATSYRALMIAGPSPIGRELAQKVNKGEKLSFDDLSKATWSVMNTTSPAGYIYPSLWLKDNYGKSIIDLKKVVISDSYGSAFARLASGQVDVLLTYADARRDQEKNWREKFGRQETIWDVTDVIGVTPAIYNDTICVSSRSKLMTNELNAAVAKAFIEIGKTDNGKKVIAVYSHNGYKEAKSSDYDGERKAQKLVKEMKKP